MLNIYRNGSIIKWLGLKPLKISTISVELVQEFAPKPIDYSQINHMECIQVGKHKSTYNYNKFVEKWKKDGT